MGRTQAGKRCGHRALPTGKLCAIHRGQKNAKGKAHRAVVAKLDLGNLELKTLGQLRDLVAKVALATLAGEIPEVRANAFRGMVPTLRRVIQETPPPKAEAEHRSWSDEEILRRFVDKATPEAIAAQSGGRLRVVRDAEVEAA